MDLVLHKWSAVPFYAYALVSLFLTLRQGWVVASSLCSYGPGCNDHHFTRLLEHTRGSFPRMRLPAVKWLAPSIFLHVVQFLSQEAMGTHNSARDVYTFPFPHKLMRQVGNYCFILSVPGGGCGGPILR